MEKTLSVEERIRKAEEIYARRKNGGTSTSIPYTRVTLGEKRQTSPIKKMLIQICICAMLYAGFYMVKNGDYIFTEQITEKIKQVLEYDMNINNISSDVLKYINEIRNQNVVIPEENKAETAPQEEEPKEDNNQNETTLEENQTQTETLGVIDEPLFTEEASSISEEQTDADYIKQNYSIIKPLTGTITSRFGSRNPTTETVPKNHTGIDIAQNIGTKIIAAMEGEVTQVSSEGDYGNHLRIVNGEITTLYAHCNKIYVSEGEQITQGQEIAEVGATGNVTGAHLHFEIKRGDTLIDPALILDF